MNYNINDVLVHKNSYTEWIITSTENNEFLLYQLNNNKINYKNKMFLDDLDIFKYFIKKENYKTYQSQNRLELLFYYIKHYNNDLQPGFIKNDDNYIFYRLSKKDYLRDFLINDIIGCSDLDLIYIAKDLTQNYNK